MLKKMLCFSSLAIVVVMLTCSYGITSCTKTTIKTDTITVIKKDTITVTKTDTLQEKDTTLTTAILTANPWKAIYDRATVGGNMFFYQRGGTTNTMNLDNEYITFKSDNTGVYTDNSGTQATFTWHFTDATNTSILAQWNSSSTTFSWENISYDDNAIHYTEYTTISGTTTLSTEVRIPK